MPTQQDIDKVKLNLSHLIDLNSDILLNGNLKIENAFALLSIDDSKDLGVQIGINLLDGAFWEASDGISSFASNFCCGVVADYSNNTPPSLMGATSKLIQRFQNTSIQFQYDLQKFYDDPTTYWDRVYSGQVQTAFGSYMVSGKLSDLATIDVPSKTDTGYTETMVNAVFGLDQQVWNTLLPNFVITAWYPQIQCDDRMSQCNENDLISNASLFYIDNPAYWQYWEWYQDRGIFGGKKNHGTWYITDYSIGKGWSIGSYGNLSDDACNYLFSDLYNGVPNPNVAFGGGLFTREFVFNNMPNIKKTSHTFNQ
jgi:hypothetical protein